MKVTTSRGKTFDVEWMWGPVGPAADLMLQLRDDRPLAEIAADFEGCEHFHRESDEEGNMDFEGYAVIKSILRPFYELDRSAVQLTLAKPVKE